MIARETDGEITGEHVRPLHINHCVLADDLTRGGRSIRDLLHARTKELALMAGRGVFDVSQSDYEQAKREVTGQSDKAMQDAILAAPPRPAGLDAEPCLTSAQPRLSRNGLRRWVETPEVADLGAIKIERNQLAYRRII
jgi:hypothetical protein